MRGPEPWDLGAEEEVMGALRPLALIAGPMLS